MRRWVALPLILTSLGTTLPGRAAAAPRPAPPAPRLEAVDGERWELTALPPVLADAEVEPNLTSGLTSTFVLQLTVRDRHGAKVVGGARIQLRYEHWDEIFHIATLDAAGHVERRTAASFADLAEWWRSLRLTVFQPPPELAAGAEIRVAVDLVPFSRSEQDDAQRWFSDSLDHSGRSSAEELAQSADESPGRLSQVFNLLMATSIGRRAAVTYRWTLAPPPRGG
jgi:hypothetical protein